MIRELAEIDVKVGHEQAFEQAVNEALPLFLKSKGCLNLTLHRSIEQPLRYRMVVEWDTVEDHTVEFRNSPAFLEWRRLSSPHFVSPPRVEHLSSVIGKTG